MTREGLDAARGLEEDIPLWESSDIDLMDCVSGFGKAYSASLNELATLSDIPGKMGTTGDDVFSTEE